MPVVLVLLMVLLGLLLLAFAVMLALLMVRTGVEAVGVNGEVSVELCYGVFRIPIWPLRHRQEEEGMPPPSRKKAKRKKKRKRKKYRYSLNRDALDIWEIADLVLRLLDELTGTLRISRLRVRVLIGTDDAAITGIVLGISAALTGMIVPFLENTFDMREYHVDVNADFEADHTEWAFTVFCSLRPLRVLWCLLRHGRELFRLYKRLIKKEEAIEHE